MFDGWDDCGDGSGLRGRKRMRGGMRDIVQTIAGLNNPGTGLGAEEILNPFHRDPPLMALTRGVQSFSDPTEPAAPKRVQNHEDDTRTQHAEERQAGAVGGGHRAAVRLIEKRAQRERFFGIERVVGEHFVHDSRVLFVLREK